MVVERLTIKAGASTSISAELGLWLEWLADFQRPSNQKTSFKRAHNKTGTSITIRAELGPSRIFYVTRHLHQNFYSKLRVLV